MKKIKFNSNKGITLIALIITVIILLILAGTAISISINGGDLFGRSQNAVAQYNNRVAEEEDALYNVLGYLGITRPDETGVEKPTGIIKVGYTETTLTVKATGGTSYQYKLSTEAEWSDPAADGTEYTFTGLTEGQSYTVQARNVDANETSDAIEKIMKVGYDGNIGRYVHYPIELGIGNSGTATGDSAKTDTGYDDDWVVFYEDETNGLTYLIAADYVPNSNAALTAARTAGGFTPGTVDNATYGFYSGGNKTSIDSEIATRNRLSWYNANRTISIYKHKVTASLLDATVWDSFVLKKTENGETVAYDSSIQAVGGPTVDLWVASWIQRGYTPLYLATNTDEAAGANGNGYYVGTSANQTSTSQSVVYNSSTFPKTGYNTGAPSQSNPSVNNPVYFPHTSAVSGCYGYWLASPSARTGANYVMYVYCGGYVSTNTFYSTGLYGVRPVVSLQSNIIGNDYTSTSDIYYAN